MLQPLAPLGPRIEPLSAVVMQCLPPAPPPAGCGLQRCAASGRQQRVSGSSIRPAALCASAWVCALCALDHVGVSPDHPLASSYQSRLFLPVSICP